MSFGGWLKKQAKKVGGAVGDFIDSDLGWIIPPLKVGYETIDWASGGSVGKIATGLNDKAPAGDPTAGAESIIPLQTDPFDQSAIAARQHEARRMSDGISETFLNNGIKPGAPVGAEPLITTMTGKEQKFAAATGGAPPAFRSLSDDAKKAALREAALRGFRAQLGRSR